MNINRRDAVSAVRQKWFLPINASAEAGKLREIEGRKATGLKIGGLSKLAGLPKETADKSSTDTLSVSCFIITKTPYL